MDPTAMAMCAREARLCHQNKIATLIHAADGDPAPNGGGYAEPDRRRRVTSERADPTGDRRLLPAPRGLWVRRSHRASSATCTVISLRIEDGSAMNEYR